MANNRLQIKAGPLDLELHGEPDYIREAYDAMRDVILDRFQEALADNEPRHRAPSTIPPALPDDVPPPQNKPKPVPYRPDNSNTTNPLFRLDAIEQQVRAGEQLVQVQLQLVVCTSLYRRVAAVSRRDFSDSIFGDFIDPRELSTVYLDEGAADRLANRMAFGNTLWRELTSAGKAVVHGEPG